MTSLLTSQKVNVGDIGFFINLGDLRTKIYQRTEPNPAGSNTGTLGGSFSTALWANSSIVPTGGVNWLSTSLATAGSAILRDLGRTVVSANRTFRKIQYVVPANRAASTFGVGGLATAGEAYYSGYIELGLGENTGTASDAGGPAPVAHYGR
jgi:hypothetical protein